MASEVLLKAWSLVIKYYYWWGGVAYLVVTSLGLAQKQLCFQYPF